MAESIPITDYKDIRKLRTKRPQNRDSARSKLRAIHALDTETYQGNVFLIADSDGRFLDQISPENVIKFLFHKKYQNAWNFFYNLGYDAEVILKLLGSELFRYRKTRKLSFQFQDYKIEYYPNKCLKINKGHHSVLFYDIAQYYDRKPLPIAYQNNIGKLPDDYLQMKEKRAEFSAWYYNHNKKKVRNYCIQDCILTRQLTEKWITLFHDAFLFYPAKWPSSGYLAEKVLINNKIEFPKFSSIPFEVQDMAYRSYFGGRFEMTKRGFIGKAYLYDINSAYPNAITHIPDLTQGKWISRKSLHENAKMGFFEIEADIPDNTYIPPFPFRANGQLIFPSGRFITYVTLAELQNCDKSWYKIRNSWQFVPDSDIYPYRKFIESLYQKRLELKQNGSPMQVPIKIILNSIYGKTGQKINRIIGNLFNPVVFSFITGFARAQLYQFVIQNNIEREVVAFATDSICTTRKLDMDSDILGMFSFEKSADDVFYLQNGFYRFDGKWKQRGLGKLGSKEIEHIDTFEKGGRLLCQLEVKRSTRLRSSIIQENLSEIGKIKSITREINLNADRKRFWLGNIDSIESCLMNESMPISLNQLDKSRI